jgi:hypothetical protein
MFGETFYVMLERSKARKFASSASGFMTKKGKWRQNNDYLGIPRRPGFGKGQIGAYFVGQLCFILLPISNSKLFSKFQLLFQGPIYTTK